MLSFLFLSLLARQKRHWGLTQLTLFGVALGVASVWSIALLNINAVEAFSASLRAITGEADLLITGMRPTFPESLYSKVLATPAVEAAWPLYHAYVTRMGRENYFYEILGLDLLAARRRGEPPPSAHLSAAEALSVPGWVAVSPALAREEHWTPGTSFDVASGSIRATLTVGDFIDFSTRAPLASNRMLVMDLSQAQTLFGGRGQLQEVDVQLRPHADRAAVVADLKARLGPAVEILTPEQQERRAEGFLEAFRLNLTALSFISLFVGMFLVYASTQASFIRQRAEYGVLRSLGATRGQLFSLFLGQAAALGIGGTLLGLPLGYLVARANLSTVSATLSNLYILSEIQTLHVSPALYGLAIAIGVGGAVGGALLPAWDMSRRDPLALLSWTTLAEHAQRWARPLAAAGLSVGGFTLLWYVTMGHFWKPSGFFVAAALMLSVTSVVPASLQLACGYWPITAFGWTYSWRALASRLQTVALATAALTASVSMLVGVTLMIQSFRETVELWAQKNLQADIYISTESWMRGRSQAALDQALVRDLETFPGVRAVDEQRYLGLLLNGHRIGLSGLRMGVPGAEKRFHLIAGNPTTAYQELLHDHAMVIGEPFSRREHLKVGDHVTFAGLHGPVSIAVAGISHDYSTDWGTAAMDFDAMGTLFGPASPNNLALYLEPGQDPARMVDTLKAHTQGRPLVIRSNRQLLAEVVRIFDQTFAVTRLLQVMCLLTAVCGISLALLILGQESAPELALYRALGATRLQVSQFFLGQGLGIGLVGIGVGTVGGVALELVLILCIHRAYFGWSIPMTWPWALLARELAIIFSACLAASLYPAWRASDTPAMELTREEL